MAFPTMFVGVVEFSDIPCSPLTTIFMPMLFLFQASQIVRNMHSSNLSIPNL
jgi:hypothetical protein